LGRPRQFAVANESSFDAVVIEERIDGLLPLSSAVIEINQEAFTITDVFVDRLRNSEIAYQRLVRWKHAVAVRNSRLDNCLSSCFSGAYSRPQELDTDVLRQVKPALVMAIGRRVIADHELKRADLRHMEDDL
jgi:hypothetical protein